MKNRIIQTRSALRVSAGVERVVPTNQVFQFGNLDVSTTPSCVDIVAAIVPICGLRLESVVCCRVDGREHIVMRGADRFAAPSTNHLCRHRCCGRRKCGAGAAVSSVKTWLGAIRTTEPYFFRPKSCTLEIPSKLFLTSQEVREGGKKWAGHVAQAETRILNEETT